MFELSVITVAKNKRIFRVVGDEGVKGATCPGYKNIVTGSKYSVGMQIMKYFSCLCIQYACVL